MKYVYFRIVIGIAIPAECLRQDVVLRKILAIGAEPTSYGSGWITISLETAL